MDMALVPYGLPYRGMKWAGLLEALNEYEALPELAGYGSAALMTSATSCGFLAPPDLAERRALAVDHGLKWLSIEEGVVLLSEARTRRQEELAEYVAASQH